MTSLGRYTRLVPLFLAACTALAQAPMHLTLAEAQRLAIGNNPRLTSAQLTAAAAAQVPKEYHAAYEPNAFVSLTGVGADNGSRLAAGGLNNPVVYDRLGSGVTVSQMITDFGRTGNLVQSAKLRAQAQDQVTESTRAQILLNVSRAYFALLRAHAVLQVADQTIAARQLVADQVSALAASKLKSTLDVSFANVNLSEARLLQAQAQSDVKAGEADLAAAMGLPNESGFQLAGENMPAALPDRVDGLIREALSSRPELKDLRLEESAQLRYAKAEHALNYPSVGLVGTAGFAPAAYDAVPGKYGAVGVNVNVPVFSGGLYKARQTEAELRAKAIAQNTADLELRIGRDVRLAYLNATTAYDKLALTRQLLAHAQSAVDLAQTRYDLGLGSIVELSQAQLAVTSAQIASTTATYDYQAQRVLVDFQTGALR
jgi:outer membrane protein